MLRFFSWQQMALCRQSKSKMSPEGDMSPQLKIAEVDRFFKPLALAHLSAFSGPFVVLLSAALCHTLTESQQLTLQQLGVADHREKLVEIFGDVLIGASVPLVGALHVCCTREPGRTNRKLVHRRCGHSELNITTLWPIRNDNLTLWPIRDDHLTLWPIRDDHLTLWPIRDGGINQSKTRSSPSAHARCTHKSGTEIRVPYFLK